MRDTILNLDRKLHLKLQNYLFLGALITPRTPLMLISVIPVSVI